MPRPKSTIETAKLTKAFADGGLAGTSAEQLADLAGVAKPTLYAHGHTKESLYLLAVDTEVERLLERLYRAERLTSGRTARDRAIGAAHAILNHGAARPDGLRLLARTAHEHTAPGAQPAPGVQAAAAAVARIPDRVSAMLKRDLATDGLDPTLAPTLARAIWGATLALATNAGGERPPNRERVARIAASCVPARPALRTEAWPTAS
jgi:AcrR family transcriptional regulator